MACQQNSREIMEHSNYLTEQARLFVTSQKPKYFETYLKESSNLQTQRSALERVRLREIDNELSYEELRELSISTLFNCIPCCTCPKAAEEIPECYKKGRKTWHNRLQFPWTPNKSYFLIICPRGCAMVLFLNCLLLIVGFIMLVKGADWFVDSAAGIAQKLHVPELVIGLTLIGFGTSAPELSVSLTSALKTESIGIAIGNVVGSNIMNIVLILGLTSLLCKIPCQKNSRILDLPYMVGSTVLFIVLGHVGNEFSRTDGIIMITLLALYIAILVVLSIRQRTNLFAEEEDDDDDDLKGFARWYKKMSDKVWFLIVMLATGLVLIIYGSDFVVRSATFIAESVGVSERIIGLTMIAFGTSLPELVTSVTAARKGKTDIAIGNIIGSNIFNILCVAGVSAAFVPLSFNGFLSASIIALGAAVLLSLLCYLPGHTIRRWGGILMLSGFVFYMAKLAYAI